MGEEGDCRKRESTMLVSGQCSVGWLVMRQVQVSIPGSFYTVLTLYRVIWKSWFESIDTQLSKHEANCQLTNVDWVN